MHRFLGGTLFLLLMDVDKWITRRFQMLWDFSFHLAMWEDRTEGGGVLRHGAMYKARHSDTPRLLFAWSTVKTGRYPGSYPASSKNGQVATEN